MKKIYLLFLIVVTSVTLNAQKVFTEYFDSATVGQTLESFNSWYVCLKDADAQGESPIIDEETLFYEGYAGSDTGYSVILDSLMGQEDASKRISTRVVQIEGDTMRPVIGQKMYAAFIISVLPGSWDSYRDFFTWEGSTGSNWSRGRVFAKTVNDHQDLQFAVSKNSSSGGNLDLAATPVMVGGLEINHLLVVVYEAIDGDKNDLVHLYVNPDPTKSEAEQDAPLTSVDEQSDYSEGTEIKINVRQRGIGAKIGGIRVGTNWEEVLQGTPTNIKDLKTSSISIRSYRNEIITDRPGSIQVYDISGRNVMNHITSGRIETSLRTGIYIVRFEDNEGNVQTGKVSLRAQ